MRNISAFMFLSLLSFLPFIEIRLKLPKKTVERGHDRPLKDRRILVQKVCHEFADKFPVNHTFDYPKSVVIDKEHQLTYCIIPKAGSTTFMAFFMEGRNLSIPLEDKVLGGPSRVKTKSYYWNKLEKKQREMIQQKAQWN